MKTLTKKNAVAVVTAVARACRKSGFTPDECRAVLTKLPAELIGPIE